MATTETLASAQPETTRRRHLELEGVLSAAVLFRVDIEDELLWQEGALCAQTDPETFFPEKGGSTRAAKRVCLSCDVREECLAYAIDHDERFGIWGGLGERERRKLKKQQARNIE